MPQHIGIVGCSAEGAALCYRTICQEGAQLLGPDNTIHQAFDLVAHRSPRPWLHIAQQVACEAKRNHFKRLAVLGTRYLMEGPVYPEKLNAAGIDYRMPGPAQREKINHIIMDEL